MRKMLIGCCLLLFAAWAAVIYLTFVVPGVVDGWAGRGLTLSTMQAWLAEASRWMAGRDHPSLTMPGAVYVSGLLLVATVVAVVWTWVVFRKRASRGADAP